MVRAPADQLIYKAISIPLILLSLALWLGLGCGSPTDNASDLPTDDDELKAERWEIATEDGTLGKEFPEQAPMVGEDAPDFSLSPIKFYGFKTEETDITEENAGLLYEPVRLSSFRGKRPVALVFGSYT